MVSPLLLKLLLPLSCLVALTTCFRSKPALHGYPWSTSSLGMAAKKKKKKKGGGGAAVGIKGFGSSGSSGSSDAGEGGGGATIDRSKEALALYDWLERKGGGSNWKRVALGHFPFGGTTIRGVVALRPIKKGEIIVGVPYEAAFNLGAEATDPTLPAVALLERICGSSSDSENPDAPYLDMLPPYDGTDCLGSTDFFSDGALEELQFPTVKKETLQRRDDASSRFEEDVSSRNLLWKNGSTVTARHLAWASWLVTSRVLTVQGPADLRTAYRLMIPLVDMCNHDRDSDHVLTGRAEPGGMLKVVAGSNVEAGEQINICYGGGVAGNDRFLQDYGFLDGNAEAYDLVAKQLLGKVRMAEKSTSAGEREEVLRTLETTTVEEDEAALSESDLASDVRAAVEFRVGVKRALAKLQTS